MSQIYETNAFQITSENYAVPVGLIKEFSNRAVSFKVKLLL